MPSYLKAAGLHTLVNELDALPAGSQLVADNVVIDKDGIIEPRRGIKQYSDTFGLSGDRAKQLLAYKNRILTHYSNKLLFDDGNGTLTAFSGNYSEVNAGVRIKGQETNGNFYFTTSEGIKKISALTASGFSAAANYINDAGGVKALDITAIVNYSSPGFFTNESRVAYRLVWAIRDANSNLILGVPSSRTLVTNFSTSQSGIVDIASDIPNEITNTNYFYQLYRTAVVQGTYATIDDLAPGDEMNLVYEANITAAELIAGTITITDIVPEDFRSGGALLYTNPVSGGGIQSANEKPPLAVDVTLFNNSLCFANTKTRHRLTVNLLGIGDFVSGTSKFVVSNGTTTNTYTFVGIAEEVDVTVDTKAATTASGYFLLNSANDERKYYIWYDKTGTDADPLVSDRIGIKVNIVASVSANDVAVATKAAIDAAAIQDFDIIVTLAVLHIVNIEAGKTTDALTPLTAGAGYSKVITVQGDGEDAASNQILLSLLPTPSQQVDATARSIVSVINGNSLDQIYAYYLSGSTDIPGSMLLEKRSSADAPFYVAVNNSTIADNFNPEFSSLSTITDIDQFIGTETKITTSAAHNLITGDTVIIYNTNSVPVINGIYTVTSTPAATEYHITTIAISTSGTAGFSFNGTTVSDNEAAANRLYFSKYQEPEAVPIVNYLDVGPKDKAILRIVALRDSLFVMKEDGVYRVSGDVAPNFSVHLLDSSSNIIASDTAAVLNNQVYMLSQQGVVTVSETGVSIVSRSIENLINNVTTPDYINYGTASFSVSYEKDRAFLLFLPTNKLDSFATQCFRFNVFTNTWTRLLLSKTCGVVNISQNKLYFGASDQNFIEIERKDNMRSDYADRDFPISIPSNSVDGNIVGISSTANVELGDSVVQSQYVTIAQFNRLLKKLDQDVGLVDNNYFTSLEMVAGDNLTNKVADLVLKLNADAGTISVYVFSGSTIFATIQSEYNVIIDTLNLDNGVFYSNYSYSTGTSNFESTIETIDKINNKITILFSLPFIEGNLTLYKGIETEIIWAPNHFGDPSVLKHGRDGTIMFRNNVFTTASIAYASDLSPSFDEIEFSGVGIGDWGSFIWGEQNWGGEGNSVPLRTLIPAGKQRFRYIKCRFKHHNARESYLILGISFTAIGVSERAYK